MDLDDLKTKIKSDPKYGDLKNIFSVIVDDVLEEREQKRQADDAADETEEGIIDSLLNAFTPNAKKKNKK